MCGICGFINTNQNYNTKSYDSIINKMNTSLFHRGPDDNGTWIDIDSGVALGHQRLAILDLSVEGKQPMASPGGRYVITYNGEIYNHYAIRTILAAKGYSFRGHSDTEVMLAAFEEWGLEAAVKRFVGMFAFALWDTKQRRLYLVRDRMGEKPLYYGWCHEVFLFGSELKALRAYPGFNGYVDRNVLALYMRHSYIPTPYSIFKGFYKLRPGTILTLDPEKPGALSEPVPYWSLHEAINQAEQDMFKGTETEAIDYLESLLRQSVRGQMAADVPVGAFLSGGIDSTTIVALMQQESNQPVKTFSIGFKEKSFNEAEYASAVARHLGTNHTELYITPGEARDVIPLLPSLYDEPFADSSQIPTYLVSKLARRQVTVSLSGDGGDEVFGGYSRYLDAIRIWNRLGVLPGWGRRAIGSILQAISIGIWDTTYQLIQSLLRDKIVLHLSGYRIHREAEMISSREIMDLYRSMVSYYTDPSQIIPGANELQTILQDWREKTVTRDCFEQMMYMDTLTYLPDDILVKVDRASMGVSLESRIPLLDHRIIELTWRLPLSMKVRDRQGKWILRQILSRYVPRELIERPKMGFGVPIDRWLRNELREWAEDLLFRPSLNQEYFFNNAMVDRLWKEHQSGKWNWEAQLWGILMFRAWQEKKI